MLAKVRRNDGGGVSVLALHVHLCFVLDQKRKAVRMPMLSRFEGRRVPSLGLNAQIRLTLRQQNQAVPHAFARGPHRSRVTSSILQVDIRAVVN